MMSSHKKNLSSTHRTCVEAWNGKSGLSSMAAWNIYQFEQKGWRRLTAKVARAQSTNDATGRVSVKIQNGVAVRYSSNC